jgi:hypothetical protein
VANAHNQQVTPLMRQPVSQDGAVADLVQDTVIVAFQSGGQVLPGECQAAGADGEAERTVRDFHAVADAHPDKIMQPRGIDHEADAQGAVRQGCRHRRRDDLLARGTPVAVDGVGTDVRHDGRDFLDVAGMLADRGPDLAVTVRTVREGVFDELIDVRGGGPMRPGMAGCAARCFGASFGRGLQVHRLHARGRGGADRAGRTLGLQVLPAFGLLAQGDDRAHGLLAGQLQDRERLRTIHQLSSAVNVSRQ